MIDERELMETLVSKISAKIPTVSVELFPDNPINYFLKHPTGAILVAGGTANMGNPNIVQQYGVQRFDLFILAHSLNKKDVGIYDLSKEARKAVEGIMYGYSRIWNTFKDKPIYNEDRWERKISFALPDLHSIGEDN